MILLIMTIPLQMPTIITAAADDDDKDDDDNNNDHYNYSKKD